uniref:Saccharopine dehydrogenase NADP binding domain-containing protein n=1 Tax=Alexandrium catenella TaxID=2925 RepID=A0A7S1QRN1_ALECA
MAEGDEDFDPFADPADDEAARCAEAEAEARTRALAAEASGSDLAPRPRPYDLVVYGATGYTGCLVCEHLDALLSAPGATAHTWAVAGRNPEKVRRLAANCRTRPGVLIASTEQGLEEMAGSCRVVINCVGPYLVHGPPVVAACVEKRTHYVDTSGEVIFVRRLIDSYGEEARRRGLMIVAYCGYDAAVFDIAGYMLAKKLGPLLSLREYTICHPIPQKGGPALSGLAMYQHASWEEMQCFLHPFSLGGERACGVREEERDPTDADKDALFPAVWVTTGLLGRVTVRCVRRTAMLFEETPSDALEYGRGACITSCDGMPTRMQARERAKMTSGSPSSPGEQAAIARAMEESVHRGERGIPGLGPGRAVRSGIRSESFVVARGESGEWAHVHYLGPEVSDATAIPAVAGALVLLEEAEKLRAEERGGVVTPAFAFHGSSWVQRVAGQRFALAPACRPMAFEVQDGQPSEDRLVEVMREAATGYMNFCKQLVTGDIPERGNEVPELLQGPPALTG